jgi:hypothetical protein
MSTETTSSLCYRFLISVPRPRNNFVATTLKLYINNIVRNARKLYYKAIHRPTELSTQADNSRV